MHKLKFGMLALSAVFLFISNPGLSFAEVVVQGDITEDTVWTASESPYLVEGQPTVATGTTLTVEPGTVVKFHGKAYVVSGLNVKGSLVAEGTPDNPIYFTSYRNDTVGTTSLSDGVAPGHDWSGIQFFASSTGTFNHVEISYTGNNDHVSAIPTIFNTGGTVTINNSVISFGLHYGVGQTSGSVFVTNSTVGNFTYGIAASGGDLRIEQNIIQNNSNVGVYSSGSGDATLVGNEFINNNIAADFSLEQNRTFVHSDNIASGGHKDGIVLRGPVSGSYVLEADKIPYFISNGGGFFGGPVPVVGNNDLLINSGGSVTFKAGVIVKLLGKYSEIVVDGTLNIQGTTDRPVYLTSIHNSDIGGVSTDLDTSVWSEYWGGITLNPGSVVNLDHAVVSYIQARPGNWGALNNLGGELNITNSEITGFQNNLIEQKSGTTTISYSSIQNNRSATIRNDSATTIDARNNYWGDASGPEHTNNPDGKGAYIYGDILFEPWLTTWPPEDTTKCSEDCYSNVLFLPGIQASRLYKGQLLGVGEERLWEPTFIFDDHDILELSMDNHAKSINDIYTKDILSYIGDNENKPVYGGFINFLDTLKSEDIIQDYSTYAYDWRYDVYDVIENGTKYKDETRYLINVLEDLAGSSRTGRVTIVAHSNGGLLGKALIDKLLEIGREDLVDNFIMVGTPQLGTPKAIGSLLHGQDQGISILNGYIPIVTEQASREASANVPGAYGLLPGQAYFNKTSDSIVRFLNGSSTVKFVSEYGNKIDSQAELDSFLISSANGRDEVGYYDLNEALPLNGYVLNKARLTRERLDEWKPPSSIKVYSLVGTGRSTVSGIFYEPIQENICTADACFLTDIYKPVPIISDNGDQTVMVASAEGVSDGAGERLYVDLAGIRNIQKLDYVHYNFTESQPVQQLVRLILLATSTQNIDFVSSEAPVYRGQHLMLGSHSPVYLTIEDSAGRRSGQLSDTEFVDEIPGVDFISIGGSSYIVTPSDLEYKANVTGYATGSVAVTAHVITESDQFLQSKVLVPEIASGTIVTLDHSVDGFSNLQVDNEGDGKVDYEITQTGEVVESKITYDLVSDYIENLDTRAYVKRSLKQSLGVAEKLHNQDWFYSKQVEKMFLQSLIRRVEFYAKMRILNQIEADELITMLNKLYENE